MKNRKLIIFLLISILLACSLWSMVTAQHAPKQVERPNILLITVCSLRQDHLGCYGYARATSPHIDRLAEHAMVFKKAYTPIPWTKPSTIALMTGSYPSANVKIKKTISLPAILQSAGYFTCALIGTNVVRDAAKAKAGFDIFGDNHNLKTSKDEATVQGDTISEKAVEVLSILSVRRKPIFMWLFFKDPHWPYTPPLAYRGKFLHDSLFKQQHQELVVNEDLHDSIGGIGRARLKTDSGEFVTDKAYYISQYDAEISFVDSQIGKVLEYLREKQKDENWVIIFLSDHGESLGEEDYFFAHGYKLSEGVVRIPLIIQLPGQTRRQTFNDPVCICDVYPTILKLAGLQGPVLRSDLYGINIIPDGRSLKIKHNPERMIMLENDPYQETDHIKLIGCIWKSFKLIYNAVTKEKTFYDISGEEKRQEGRSRDMQAISTAMTDSLFDFFKSPPSSYSNPDNIEELRSLGYLQ